MAESALSLADKIRSALDRTEEIARAADPGPWVVGQTQGMFDRFGEPDFTNEVTVIDGEAWPRFMTIRGTHVVSKPAEGNGRVIANMSRGYLRSRHLGNAEFMAAYGPDSVLRSVAAHRKIIERYEIAVIARDAAVDTPLAGATRMALRLARENVEIVASIYFPEDTPDDQDH